MKKFQTLTAVALTAVLAFSFAGCGSTSDETAPEATTEAAASQGGETANVSTVEEGKLIWGTNAAFPPYEYMEGDEVTGIDAEIADAVAAKLGLEAQVENMDFDAIIPAVTSGKVDIGIAGITVSEERLVNVNFTSPYVEAGQAILVNEGSDIASAADLNGKIIGVQRGTTGDDYVSDDANGVGAAEIQRFSDVIEAGQALKSGKIEAIVIDNEPAKSVAASAGLVKLDENLTSEQYAIAVNKDNTALLDAINNALAEMEEDGSLQSILDKYLVDNAEEVDGEADAETTTAA